MRLHRTPQNFKVYPIYNKNMWEILQTFIGTTDQSLKYRLFMDGKEFISKSHMYLKTSTLLEMCWLIEQKFIRFNITTISLEALFITYTIQPQNIAASDQHQWTSWLKKVNDERVLIVTVLHRLLNRSESIISVPITNTAVQSIAITPPKIEQVRTWIRRSVASLTTQTTSDPITSTSSVRISATGEDLCQSVMRNIIMSFIASVEKPNTNTICTDRVTRLVYMSHALSTSIIFDDERMYQYREKNRKQNITGVLVYVPTLDLYIQVLEGPADAVIKLFTKIQKDVLHDSVDLVDCSNCVRSYHGWEMNTLEMKRTYLDQCMLDSMDLMMSGTAKEDFELAAETEIDT